MNPTTQFASRLTGVITLCAALAYSSLVHAETLRMVAADWPPYVSRDLPGNGIIVAIVTEALTRDGQQTELRIDNWPRALEGIKIGVFDLVAGTWKDAEREAFLVYSDAIIENEIILVTLSERFIQYNELDDLQGLFIGVESDYAYQADFLQHQNLIRLERRNLIQNIHGLLEGEIDVVIADRLAFMHAVNSYLPGSRHRFRILDKPLEIKSLHLGISRKLNDHEQILESFNSQLQEMRNDGSYATIMQEYSFTRPGR